MSAPRLKNEARPYLPDVLQELKRDIFATINCVQIGIVEEFDPTDQTATIRLALKQVKSVNPDGTRILQEHPLLLKCPVVMLFGGLSFITLDISPGDNCIVLFNDREIDEWFTNGGVQTPQTFRAHDLSDGFAIVGIRSMQDALASYLANGLRLAYGANSKIDLTSGAISSLAALFLHTGDFRATGDVRGATVTADNGATGNFDQVQVVNGIVVSGS